MCLINFLSYPRKILLIGATWPKYHSSLGYKIRRTVTLANILSLLLCLSYNASFHMGDFVQFSESLYMLISVVNAFLKIVLLTLNGKVFLKLIGMLETPSFKRFETLYKKIVKDFLKTVKAVEFFYWIEVSGTVLFLSLFPIFESEALPMDFPHFNNGTFHYPFYIFEAFSLFVSAYDNMAVDLLTVGIISIAAVQLRILNQKLVDTDKNIKNMPNYSVGNVERLTIGYLTECCIHYSDIEKYVKSILEVFSVIIFVQLGTSVVAICNAGMMILSVKLASIEALSLFFYIVTMFAQLGMYCWFGNFVYVESLEVTTSCYLSHWDERRSAVRKTLFMLMERAKKPLAIRAVKFATLSFDTFIAIIKWSYSYFALLNNSMKN
ncbi:odorant receptor 94a-like [Dendroctonus ponderosae]|uniref:odorant receptor 94a-like n=1 Tax=Dendroctonus ponderosae TaxID=77166 RepID=UPI002035EB57|nr:odorant receptor 94a-like [Dendroctonus ponderosae]